jgi:hypothetical protein
VETALYTDQRAFTRAEYNGIIYVNIKWRFALRIFVALLMCSVGAGAWLPLNF